MDGRALAADLAVALRESREGLLTWEQLLTPGGIADLFAISTRSGIHDTRVYEIKVSRADFRSGVTRDQHGRYMERFKRFFYAVPAGLVKRAEVPPGCGLIVRGVSGWRVVTQPTPQNVPEPPFAFMAQLLAQRMQDYRVQRRLKDEIVARENHEWEWQSRKFGREMAGRLARLPVEVKEPTRDERERSTFALDVLAKVEASMDTLGHGRPSRWSPDSVDRVAEYAVALLQRAAVVRQAGSMLSRLPYALQSELDEVVAAWS